MKQAISLLKDGLKYLSWLGEKLDPNHEQVENFIIALERAFELGELPDSESQQSLFDPEEYRRAHEAQIIERLNDLVITTKQESILMASKGNLHMLEILKRTMQTLHHALLTARVVADELIKRHNDSVRDLEELLGRVRTDYGQSNAAHNARGFIPFLSELYCEPIITDEEKEEISEVFVSEDESIRAIYTAASGR